MTTSLQKMNLARATTATVLTVLIGLSTIQLMGCGQPQSQFLPQAGNSPLMVDAQKQIDAELLTYFGTPQELVAWERLPINYGGAKGKVAAGTLSSLRLNFEAPLAERFREGDSVQWVTGGRKNKQGDTVGKVGDDGKLTINGKGDEPATDDEVLVGYGSSLQLGRMAYHKNCLHCHGVAGDGQGPTSRYLNPKPRDYTLGVFKFTSTMKGVRATRDDLTRVIRHGIPGTYMPSFLLMDDKEVVAIVEYVRWLAIRGQFEGKLRAELKDFSKAEESDDKRKELVAYFKDEFPGVLDTTAESLVTDWTNAESPATLVLPQTARVEDTAESRERGRLLYLSDKAKCYTCHGMTGRGDGTSTVEYWPMQGTTKKYGVPGLHDDWANPIPPRDLTRGQYRGGRRPLDLYRRIHAGIKGTPMPAFGGTVLNDEQIWDLVNYVMSIPFDARAKMRQPHPGKKVAHSDKH